MKRPIQYLIWLALVSCDTHESLTDAERREIVAAIRKTLDHYYDDIREEGLTAEFRYLDNSDSFFWVPPGYVSPLSYDSVAAILKQNAPKFQLVDNKFDTLTISPLSKELASYTGRLRSVMTDTTGKSTTYVMIETGIMIRRNEEWKLLSGQTTLLSAPQ